MNKLHAFIKNKTPLIAAANLALALSPASAGPSVVIMPPTNPGHDGLKQLLQHPEQWPQTRARATASAARTES